MLTPNELENLEQEAQRALAFTTSPRLVCLDADKVLALIKAAKDLPDIQTKLDELEEEYQEECQSCADWENRAEELEEELWDTRHQLRELETINAELEEDADRLEITVANLEARLKEISTRE